MRRDRLGAAIRTTAGVLSALLAVSLVAPGAARAGCLHPLAAAASQGPAHLDLLATAGALAALADETPPSPPVSPCAGLRCSGEPAPVPSPVTTAIPRAVPWGLLAGQDCSADPTGRPLPPGTLVLHPTHGGPSPFHPPR